MESTKKQTANDIIYNLTRRIEKTNAFTFEELADFHQELIMLAKTARNESLESVLKRINFEMAGGI